MLSSHNIAISDAFLGLSLMGPRLTFDTLTRALTQIKSRGVGSCEVMVHPGYANKGLGGCGVVGGAANDIIFN